LFRGFQIQFLGRRSLLTQGCWDLIARIEAMATFLGDIAEGTWDLLGTDPYASIFGVPADGRIRMVAGGGFEPPTFGL